MSDAHPAEYQDLSGLAGLLKAALAVFILICAVGLWSGGLEIELLSRIQAGGSFTEAEAGASDSRQATIGLLYFLAFLGTAVLFLRWTYLSNKNARALGSTDMEFTPGWSAGWYFVPILTLWKPYQALRETFKASHPASEYDADWRQAPHPGIMPIWWTLWLISGFVGQAVFRMSLSAETIDELLVSSWMIWISDAVEIPLGIVVIVLVGTLTDWQERKYERVGRGAVGVMRARDV